MPYSAVTQPLPVLYMNGGTFSCTDAVQITRVSPTSISTLPSACLMKFGVMLTGRRTSTARPSDRVFVEVATPLIQMAPHPPFGHLLPEHGEKGKTRCVAPRPAQREEGGRNRKPGEGKDSYRLGYFLFDLRSLRNDHDVGVGHGKALAIEIGIVSDRRSGRQLHSFVDDRPPNLAMAAH